jgi:hypothetical protein
MCPKLVFRGFHQMVHLLLALVLLCAGFTAPDKLLALLQSGVHPAVLQSADHGSQHAALGADHEDRSDDLSLQPHGDVMPDLLGVLGTKLGFQVSPLTLAQSPPCADDGHQAPYLAGLQRPPCRPAL